MDLTDYLIELADEHLPEMTLQTPRAHAERGGHIVLEHPDAKQLSAALRARDIIPDYREPNLLRLAPAALYNMEAELEEVVEVLKELLASSSYKKVKAEQQVT